MINAELASKVLAHIKDDLARWRQANWMVPTDAGAAYCFGAWAVELSGITIQLDALGAYIRTEDVPGGVEAISWPFRDARITVKSVATSLLGLSEDQAERLFDAENEFEDLERLVNDFITDAYSAEINEFLGADTELEEGLGEAPEAPGASEDSEALDMEEAPF